MNFEFIYFSATTQRRFNALQNLNIKHCYYSITIQCTIYKNTCFVKK